jgi:hypothetical protein
MVIILLCGWRAGTYEGQKLFIESCRIGVPLTYDFHSLLGALSSFPSGSGSDRSPAGSIRVAPFYSACEMTMMAHPQRKLRLVKNPKFGRPRAWPPVPDTSSDTIDFLCGNCGILLMHVNEGQVHGVFIHCTECGACNTST